MTNHGLLLTAPNALIWAAVPDPGPPKPDEVTVHIAAFALNHLDLFSMRGMAFARRTFPLIGGVEGAGVVVALGSNVNELLVGARVVIFPGVTCGQCKACRDGRDNLCVRPSGVMGFHRDGVAAQRINVPARLLVHVPDAVCLVEAATAPVTYATVLHMLVTNAKLARNETVLVHAAGSGIGSVAIKIAKALGASVIATVGSDEKIALAREIGADEVINYRKSRFEMIVRRLTSKRGVDVVFEHVGANTWRGSMLSLALGGRLVICGATSGLATEIDLLQLFNRQIKIFGSFGGAISDVRAGLGLMAAGIRPQIDSIVAPDEVPMQLARLAGRDVFGKIIVSMEKK